MLESAGPRLINSSTFFNQVAGGPSMRLRIAVIILFAVLAASAQAESPVPIYSRLKTYRSYMAIKRVDRFAHRFMMWFVHIEPTLWIGAGNTVEEIEALDENAFSGGWGAFGMPPQTVPPVPQEFEHLAEAMRRKVRQIYPEVK